MSPVRIEGEKPVETDWNKPECGNAKSHDEADLCEQRRMAEAAEKTVLLNQIQLIAGIVTIALLFLTVHYSRKATLAAVCAAEASVRSADIAERSLIELQRAMIVLVKFQTDTIIRGQQVIAYQISAVLENTGPTPAKKFTGTANIVMWDGPLPDDFEYPDRTAPAGPTGFVGPRVAIPYPIGIAIQDVQDIAAKKRRGFMYGWVEYDDIFSKSVKHRMEFCAEIEVVGDPLIVNQKGSVLAFGGFGRYNATDEDCLYHPGQRPPVGGLPPPTQPPPESQIQL